MRILFTRFPLESALGGAENQTLWLMEGLIERGHAVAFAGSCPVLLTECRKRNIPVAEVDIGKPPVTKWGAISFAWRKQMMQKQLQQMLQSFEKIDVIAMLSLSEKLLLTDIAADAGTNVCWIEHDRIGRWLSGNPWLSLLLKQSQKAITIAVSELSRKMYLELGWNAERIIAIPNGVDRAPGPRPLASRGHVRLGCISRLSHEKGIDVLIRAMADAPTDIQLEIIGTGREESALKSLARSLNVDARITFTPRIPNIGDAYGRFDALVLPSREHDPFGLVAAEAMLAGVPVIVTDACGIADYLENGKDAFVVKANSVSALSEAISQLVARSSQLSVGGRKTAEKKFTTERMVEEYEKIFAQKNR